jgi:sulfur-carrier protein
MKITIKTYANIKELCGFKEKELIVSEGISVLNVIQELCKTYGCLKNNSRNLLFAINEEYCSGDSILADNDVLAIFPPVSGG